MLCKQSLRLYIVLGRIVGIWIVGNRTGVLLENMLWPGKGRRGRKIGYRVMELFVGRGMDLRKNLCECLRAFRVLRSCDICGGSSFLVDGGESTVEMVSRL